MTQVCFVAGQPIAHSRSPLIHGHWIKQLGLDATYQRIECAPDDLPALISRIRTGELTGGNFTVPLKEAVIPHLDQLTQDATRMRAVNTVYRRDGVLWGANTDVPGYFAHLSACEPGWTDDAPKVLLLGAGGAARAIAFGLLDRGAKHVTVANRSPDRAESLLSSLDNPKVTLASWPVSRDEIHRHKIIINATSLGMKGQPLLELDLPDDMTGQIVSDIVYVPLTTGLLSMAGARGARTVDGLGMLLHQAALAFEAWFGMRPLVTEALHAAIATDIEPGRNATP